MPTGIKRNKAEKAAYAAHLRYMELENIIDEFSNAMRSANMRYVAKSGMTPRMIDAWARYQIFAGGYL